MVKTFGKGLVWFGLVVMNLSLRLVTWLEKFHVTIDGRIRAFSPSADATSANLFYFFGAANGPPTIEDDRRGFRCRSFH